jgi:hypothetical protein
VTALPLADHVPVLAGAPALVEAAAEAARAPGAPVAVPATGEAAVALDWVVRQPAPADVDSASVDYPARPVPGHLSVVRTLPQPAAAQVGPVSASGGNPAPVQQHEPEGDSINRGLLLKFLSSVRS